MPYALTVEKIAQLLTRDAVAGIAADAEGITALAERGSLVDVAAEAAGLDADERAYLDSVPPVLLEAMRAAIVEAVGAGKAVHLQYSPAYEYSVQVWDFGQAVSIHLSGPYPAGYSGGPSS